MVVLPGCWSIKVVDSGGDLVHLLARRDVLRRISPSRVVGNKDPPRIVLGLRMQANGHVDLSVTRGPGRGRRASVCGSLPRAADGFPVNGCLRHFALLCGSWPARDNHRRRGCPNWRMNRATHSARRATDSHRGMPPLLPPERAGSSSSAACYRPGQTSAVVSTQDAAMPMTKAIRKARRFICQPLLVNRRVATVGRIYHRPVFLSI